MSYIHPNRKSPILVSNKHEAAKLRASYNHTWTLSPEDRDRLGIYLLVKTTVGELLEKIDISHSYIDYLTYPYSPGCHLTCRVNFVNGCVSYLEELRDQGKESEICLVSVRMARVSFPTNPDDYMTSSNIETTTVALVLISPSNINVDGLKCYSLNGKEVKE